MNEEKQSTTPRTDASIQRVTIQGSSVLPPHVTTYSTLEYVKPDFARMLEHELGLQSDLKQHNMWAEEVAEVKRVLGDQLKASQEKAARWDRLQGAFKLGDNESLLPSVVDQMLAADNVLARLTTQLEASNDIIEVMFWAVANPHMFLKVCLDNQGGFKDEELKRTMTALWTLIHETT